MFSSMFYGYIKVACETYIYLMKRNELKEELLTNLEEIVSIPKAMELALHTPMPYRFRSLYLKFINRVYLPRMNLKTIIDLIKNHKGYVKHKEDRGFSEYDITALYLNDDFDNVKEESIVKFRSLFNIFIDHIINAIKSPIVPSIDHLKYVYRACQFIKQGFLYGCLQFYEVQYSFTIIMCLLKHRNEVSNEKSNMKEKTGFNLSSANPIGKVAGISNRLVWIKIEVELFSILELCSYYRQFFFQMLFQESFRDSATNLEEKCTMIFKFLDLNKLVPTVKPIINIHKLTKIEKKLDSIHPVKEGQELNEDNELAKQNLFSKLTEKKKAEVKTPAMARGLKGSGFGQLANINMSKTKEMSKKFDNESYDMPMKNGDDTEAPDTSKAITGKRLTWAGYDIIFLEYNAMHIDLKKRLISPEYIKVLAKHANDYKNLLIKMRRAQVKSVSVFLIHASHKQKVISIINSLFGRPLSFIDTMDISRRIKPPIDTFDIERSAVKERRDRTDRLNDQIENDDTKSTSEIPDVLFYYMHKLYHLDECFDILIKAFTEFADLQFSSDKFFDLQTYLRSQNFLSLFKSMKIGPTESLNNPLHKKFLEVLEFYVKDNYINQKHCWPMCDVLVKLIVKCNLKVANTVISIVKSHKDDAGVYAFIKIIFSEIERIYTDSLKQNSDPQKRMSDVIKELTKCKTEVVKDAIRSKHEESPYDQLISIISGVAFTHQKYNINIANYVYELINKNSMMADLLNMKVTMKFFGSETSKTNSPILLLLFDLAKISPNNLIALSRRVSSDIIGSNIKKQANDYRLKIALLEFYVACYLSHAPDNFEKNHFIFVVNEVILADMDQLVESLSSSFDETNLRSKCRNIISGQGINVANINKPTTNNLQVQRSYEKLPALKARKTKDIDIFAKFKTLPKLLQYFYEERNSRISGLFVLINNVLELLKKYITIARDSKEKLAYDKTISDLADLKINELRAQFEMIVNHTEFKHRMKERLIPGSLSHIQFSSLLFEIEANLAILMVDSQQIERITPKNSDLIVKIQSDVSRKSRIFPAPILPLEQAAPDYELVCKKFRNFIFTHQVSLKHLISSFMFQSKGRFGEKLSSLLSLIECPEQTSMIIAELDPESIASTPLSRKTTQRVTELSFNFIEILIRNLCIGSKYPHELPKSDHAPFYNDFLRSRLIETEKGIDKSFFWLGRYKELIKSIEKVSIISSNSFCMLFSNFVPKDPKTISNATSIKAPYFFLSLNEIALQNLLENLREGSEKNTRKAYLNLPISVEIIKTIITYFIHSKSDKLITLCLKIFFQYSKINNKEFMTSLFNVLCSESFLFAEFLKCLNSILKQTGHNYYGDLLNADHNRRFNANFSVDRNKIEKTRERLKNILHLLFLIFSSKLSVDTKFLYMIEKNNADIEMTIYKTTANIFLKIDEILCQVTNFDYSKLDKTIMMRIFMILEISLKSATWDVDFLWRSFENYISQLRNISKLEFGTTIKKNYFYCIYVGLLVKLINLLWISIKEMTQKYNHLIHGRDFDCFLILCENVYQEVIKPKKKLFIMDKICTLSKKATKNSSSKCTLNACKESSVSLNDYSLYETAFKSYLAYKEILGDRTDKERDDFWKRQAAMDPSLKRNNSSFEYFKTSEVNIQICLKGTLINYSFQKQLICSHFNKVLKKKFLARLSKTHSHDDYRIIFDEILTYYEEMTLSEKFSNNFLMEFAAHHADVLSLIIYIFTICINIFLLVFVKVIDDTESETSFANNTFIFYVLQSINTSNKLIVVYLVFGVFTLILTFYDLTAKLMLSWYKSSLVNKELMARYELKHKRKNMYSLYENSLDKISLKIQKEVKNVIRTFISRHRALKKISNLFTLNNIYSLVFSLWVLASILYPFFWPFILLDVFRINSGLNHLMKSFKYNIMDILKVFWICVIIMYIYATIIFTFFNTTLTDNDPNSESYFTNLSSCFYQTVINGLVLHGSIGEYLVEVDINDSGFLRRFFLDVSFFFIILVVVLNNLYAIIIDTYFTFSRKQKNTSKSLEKICYICQRNQYELKLIDEDFSLHVKGNHNAENYFFLFVNLFLGKASSSNYIERVLTKMVAEKDFSFIPMKPKPKFN